jgi:hypothetical protein
MPIDDRTPNRSYKLPNAANLLSDDVQRLRDALAAIDADVYARYTKTEVDQLISGLINGAPGALDTLNELAAALGDDANFAATVANSLTAINTALADRYTKTESDARYVQGVTQTENVFTGNGSQTTFTLTQTPPTRESLIVTVDGVVQPTSEYNLIGSSLILSEAPASGAKIRVLMLGVAGPVQSASTLSFAQAGAGAVTRTVDSKLKDVVSVKDFGAVGDGVTDDTAAIQAAADYCQSSGAFLTGVPGIYKTSATITLNCSGNLGMMQIRCPGATVSPAVRIGTATGTAIFFLDLIAPKVYNSSKTGAGWTGFETSIGVDCGNLYDSKIEIPYVYGFGYNIYVGGYNIGNSYNEYKIGRSQEGKVGLRVAPRSATGWANENNFYGGKLAKSSSEGTSPIVGGYALQVGADPGQAWSCNNNVFYKPAVEDISLDEYQIYFNNTAYNTVINARFEVTGGTGKVKLSADSDNVTRNNTFIGGYNLADVTWTVDSNSSSTCVFGSGSCDVIDGGSSTKATLTLGNSYGSGEAVPHIAGFPATYGSVHNKSNSNTEWVYRLHGSGISVKSALSTYARIRLNQNGRLQFSNGSTSDPDTFAAHLVAGSSGEIRCAANYQPDADGARNLGAGSLRWSQLFAATGTINTSDEREKQDISELDETELRVAVAIKGLVKKFRYKDAVSAKGNEARVHVGVIAQEVIDAFASEGLDPMSYGIVCHDEWEAEYDEDGNEVIPAGSRYGIRYEELLAFVLAAL